ncbi:MAG: UDP-N-acetylmuramoyl-tripeptide--D-alanyl-D-alanine ligase [Patescibacteria group bacterium]
MKPKKIIYLEKMLRFMAKAVLRKYKPVIVGITGSVGKTSTKEAVFLVLCLKFFVRKNEKNYNNEIGLPLTIIGAENGNKSPLKWAKVFLKWLYVIIFPASYPEILILEMGVDRPGDMEYLTSFIKPTVGIFTNVHSSHLEYFKSVDYIAREKGKIIQNIPEEGVAILNGDDEKVHAFKTKMKAKSITIGLGDENDIKATDVSYGYNEGKLQGISFKLNYEGKIIPIRLPQILAPHFIYSVLSAVASGLYFKMNLVDIAKSLENFSSPQGRMKLVEGMSGSLIIDDTYNSSPKAVISALNVLEELKALRKIVILGDMLELGIDSEKSHEEVVRKTFESGASIFFAVGDRIAEATQKIFGNSGKPGNIFFFDNPDSAGCQLAGILRDGDLVLIKGSQGMRMEKVVEKVIPREEDAKILLCRQSKDWKNKAFSKP